MKQQDDRGAKCLWGDNRGDASGGAGGSSAGAGGGGGGGAADGGGGGGGLPKSDDRGQATGGLAVRNVVASGALRTWACLLFVAMASAQTTQRVSVDSAGGQANHRSRAPVISADGRHVAFESLASNLVPGDTNAVSDVFVHDRRTGQTLRVSVEAAGAQANGASESASMSDDGRFVAFTSVATNLVAGDTNGASDVFVRDLVGGTTRRVSVDSNHAQADAASSSASLSPDGRFVVFASAATNLVPLDTNAAYDVFLHDLRTGLTSRVSVGASGAQSNGGSYAPSVSRDGRVVAFGSAASNLAAPDTNGVDDVFVRDVPNSVTTMVSVDAAGAGGDRVSFRPAISADGRCVAFASDATNLVAGDTNDVTDVFVRDLVLGSTRAIRVDASGTPGDGPSVQPRLSRDGRFVVFASLATNWIAGDTNGAYDVFVHDRSASSGVATTRVSLSGTGAEVHGVSYGCSISADGRHVSFDSSAGDVVPNDTNAFVDVFARDR